MFRDSGFLEDLNSSRKVRIQSSALKGTVLGLLMFILHINHISDNINTLLHLFDDDHSSIRL